MYLKYNDVIITNTHDWMNLYIFFSFYIIIRKYAVAITGL